MFNSDGGRKFLKVCAVCGITFLVNAEATPYWFESRGVHCINHLEAHTHQENHPVQSVSMLVAGMATTMGTAAISGDHSR